MLDYWTLAMSDPLGQMYSYRATNGEVSHFAINPIVDWCKSTKLEVTRWELSDSLVKKVLLDCGIEHPKVLSLMSNSQAMNRPIILMEDENKKHIVIDGNHRVVAKAAMGHRTIRAWKLTEEEIAPFRVAVPDVISRMYAEELGEQRYDHLADQKSDNPLTP